MGTLVGGLLIVSSALVPITPPKAAVPTTTTGLIAHYSAHYGVSAMEIKNTISCESQFNPKAYNQSGASGIAQFMPSTFNHYSKLAGVVKGSVWNKEDSIRTMAYMWSKGQAYQWECAHMLGYA